MPIYPEIEVPLSGDRWECLLYNLPRKAAGKKRRVR